MLLTNLRINNGETLLNVRVENGKFVRIAPDIKNLPGEETIDFSGKLALPPFVESHVHLDTCLTAGDPAYNRSGTLFEGIEDNTHFYFANSFYMPVGDYTIASASYDVTFTAAVQKDNYYGVQFHPEKSGEAGIKLLQNFIEKC